jgi:uncharacterized protein
MEKALVGSKSIAVVGISENPMRPSHDVATSLQRAGYSIVPVNPTLDSWEGLRAYPSVKAAVDAGVQVDLVDVFRRPEYLKEVVDDALAAGVPAIWFQLGVIDLESAKRARDAGLTVVVDRCTKVELHRFGR